MDDSDQTLVLMEETIARVSNLKLSTKTDHSHKRPIDLAVSMEISEVETNKAEDADLERGGKRLKYLLLPEEPGGDGNMLCRVGIRLPDGRRSRRNFHRNDPMQLLWSYCSSELKEDGEKPFRLTYAIPGASKSLDFDYESTFEDSGLASSLITVAWDE